MQDVAHITHPATHLYFSQLGQPSSRACARGGAIRAQVLGRRCAQISPPRLVTPTERCTQESWTSLPAAAGPRLDFVHLEFPASTSCHSQMMVFGGWEGCLHRQTISYSAAGSTHLSWLFPSTPSSRHSGRMTGRAAPRVCLHDGEQRFTQCQKRLHG